MAKKGQNIAPFLAKCYEMVDDESTDSIISWGPSNDSFIIWDVSDFTQNLLPNFFKHSNFASFMRQLNIYGFRKKVETDRWEFVNEAFIKGQRHLLKGIKRRKHTQFAEQKNPQLDQPTEISHAVDYTHLEEEVGTLKFDKTVLMQEFSKLRERQESSQNKLILLGERLQGMENSQQQLLSFLVMVMQSPGLLVQLLQPKESSWRVAKAGKITLDQGTEHENTDTSDALIVRYQPLPGDASSTTPRSLPKSDKTSEHNMSFDGIEDFFMKFDFPSPPLDDSLFCPENWGSIVQPQLDLAMLEQPQLDLAKLEEYLLSSPSRDEPLSDGEETSATEMEMEMEQAFRAADLTENSAQTYSDLCTEDLNQSPSLEFLTLTKQMGCLSPGRKD